MNSMEPISSARDAEEVSALVEILFKAGRRLEELGGGELDTVADPEGRTFLLRGTAEQLRRREIERQAAILNALPANVALLDRKGVILLVNDSWRRFATANRMQGLPGCGVGQNYLTICDGAAGGEALQARMAADGIRAVLSGERLSFSLEYECHSAVERRWFLLTATPLAEDLPNGAIVMHLNITERRLAEEASRISAAQMTYFAQHDFLTGMPNRMLLNDRIGQAIETTGRTGSKTVVLFLDLDGFKHINDSLGHPTGDKLLQSIAKRLTGCVRASDTVSRDGGDEFIVLLSEVVHPETVAILANRMMQAVAKPHSIDEHDLHVTTSIGVSVYPQDGLDAMTLIKNADTAMYQAKENGRSALRFFQQPMNVRAVERQSMEEDLRHALERREFALHYQPKIDLTTGAIIGAEALLRWTHSARGAVPPAKFIPVAEDSGLILPIGNWVLGEACGQAKAWVDAGLPVVTMAVNLSGLQFQSEDFLEDLFAILDKTGFDPKSLEVEVTESLFIKRLESTRSILQALRDKGVHVAIDDFGTGYSSLSHLHKLPLDALKIDQSFVREITTTPNENSIVKAIIRMGQSLKLRIIAEGVETDEELAFLQAQSCDEAQGYLFSRPIPSGRFATLLEKQARPGGLRPGAAFVGGQAFARGRTQRAHHRASGDTGRRQ